MSLTLVPKPKKFLRSDLHRYQNRAVQFIKDTPFCALWVGMGLGKTISVLTAVSDLLSGFEVRRILIIAPLRVAQTTWPEELRRWEHVSHLSYKVLAGLPPARRLDALLNDASDIHIINRELVPWLVETLQKQKNGWPYDVVVVDESSSFKSHKTKRFRALRKVVPHTDRLIELTGTPASNGLLDVWSQIFLLDQGARLGKTFGDFQNRFFYCKDRFGYYWSLKHGAAAAIHYRLKYICLTLKAEDYLEVPARIDRLVPVELPPKARRVYRNLERDFLAEVAGETVEVLSAAALSNKLLQCANGALYTDDKGGWEALHSAKLDAFTQIVEEACGEPLLVAYTYKTDAMRLLERFPQAQMLGKNPDQIAAWNRKETPILLAHPASAAYGLNLQHGGNHIVWFGLNWSLELYEQFNARLHRQGQKKPVLVQHIVAENTVDQTVLAALGRKHITQRDLLDALRDDAMRRQV